MSRTNQERKELVSYYLVKGVTETEIAKTLHVSRKTITRDITFLKKASRSWIDGLAKDGFIYEYKLALDKIKDHGAELQKILSESKDISQKLHILKALDENAKLYLELLGERPTVHAIRRARNVQTP